MSWSTLLTRNLRQQLPAHLNTHSDASRQLLHRLGILRMCHLAPQPPAFPHRQRRGIQQEGYCLQLDSMLLLRLDLPGSYRQPREEWEGRQAK